MFPKFSEAISTTTSGVKVEVQSTWMQARSNALAGRFVFAYRVRITNESERAVKLLRRKWIITDGFGQTRVVKGDGVIGLHPLIKPGATHEYISGCDFPSPIGQMRGHYEMILPEGQDLRVRIPRFTMIVPYLLN